MSLGLTEFAVQSNFNVLRDWSMTAPAALMLVMVAPSGKNSRIEAISYG
jgi:hypothetical protein